MERNELHDLVAVLKEEFESGRIVINSPETLRALAEVKFGNDGKVDPSTVSSSVRAVALAVAARRYERELEQVSLRDVQQSYFDLLDRFFGGPFSEMRKHRLDPQTVAMNMVANEKLVSAFALESDEFAAEIKDFWERYGPVVQSHLQSLHSLKTVFGGDVFPSYTANIACSVGLYADTIVLPDPLHKLVTFVGFMQPKELLRLTAKHALNALSYRDLALAELDVPIVVIAPDYLADDSYRKSLTIATEPELLEHYSRIFGRRFISRQELETFVEPLSQAEELIARVANPSRLLFDTEWSGSTLQQFERYSSEAGENFQGAPRDPRRLLEMQVFGRFMQTNDVVFRGERYNGTPLIDAPTSWQYLLWKYEYSADAGPEAYQNLAISNAMALEGKEHGMLNGLPPSALIELRRNGATSELREMLCKGIGAIDSASEETVSNVGKQVIENVDNAFSEHERQLKALSSSRNGFYGVDVSRYLASGAVAIAASVKQSVSLGVLSGLIGMTGVPGPQELHKRFRELGAQADKLRRSPAGIMFKHIKRNFGFSR